MWRPSQGTILLEECHEGEIIQTDTLCTICCDGELGISPKYQILAKCDISHKKNPIYRLFFDLNAPVPTTGGRVNHMQWKYQGDKESK